MGIFFVKEVLHVSASIVRKSFSLLIGTGIQVIILHLPYTGGYSVIEACSFGCQRQRYQIWRNFATLAIFKGSN